VSRRDEQRVKDILDAADQVVDIAQVGRDAWDKDRLRQLATERLLEIIGESANTLTEEFRAQHPEVPWRDIIGLRRCRRGQSGLEPTSAATRVGGQVSGQVSGTGW
jgi:uncharacterized protein with HEPN domain